MFATETEKYVDCKNEQEFKMMYLKENKDKDWYDFCIETEETVKGFPDVMLIEKQSRVCIFYEFKFTKTGKIKFQPTQPAFYKLHHSLVITIVAYNAKTKTLHKFGALNLFNLGSRYSMNEKAEVDLCKAEKLMMN